MQSQYDEEATQKSLWDSYFNDGECAFRGTAPSVAATDDDDDDGSVGGGVWVEPEREGGNAGSSKERGRTFTAFDPQGVAHRRASPQSEAPKSVHSGWASWGIKEPRAHDKSSTQPPVRKRNPGFAKVPVSVICGALCRAVC